MLFGFGLPVEPLNHLHRGSHILRQEIDADLFQPEGRIGVTKGVRGSLLTSAVESQPSKVQQRGKTLFDGADSPSISMAEDRLGWVGVSIQFLSAVIIKPLKVAIGVGVTDDIPLSRLTQNR